MGKWGTTIIFIVLAAVLTQWIPFSSFFRNVDTMIHEFGHALLTLILSGKVLYIHLFSDHSGVTYSSVSYSWRFIPISLAGYIMASGFTVLLFGLYAKGKSQIGLILLSGIAALNVIFFVRNTYGVLWCIGFIICNIIVIYVPWGWLREFYFTLIAFVGLVESVLGPIYLVVTALQSPSQAGDAANLSQLTFIPAAIWALIFSITALLCARYALGYFMQGFRRSRRT
jgi:hypothetical protein